MIRVLDDRVLVALPPYVETETASGIILKRDPDLIVNTRGIVVQLGEKRERVSLDDVIAAVNTAPFDWRDREDDIIEELQKLRPAPFDVAVGECVIFPASAGEDIERDGITYRILSEADIIGVVEPVGQERAWLESLATLVNRTLQEKAAAA